MEAGLPHDPPRSLASAAALPFHRTKGALVAAQHHRPLVTSAIAGGLLCALWFVPSAKASHEADEPTPGAPSAPSQQPGQEPAGWEDPTGHGGAETTHDARETAEANAEPATNTAHGSDARLADTGSFDTTPYMAGGLAFLALGSGLTARSIRLGRPPQL